MVFAFNEDYPTDNQMVTKMKVVWKGIEQAGLFLTLLPQHPKLTEEAHPEVCWSKDTKQVVYRLFICLFVCFFFLWLFGPSSYVVFAGQRLAL